MVTKEMVGGQRSTRFVKKTTDEESTISAEVRAILYAYESSASPTNRPHLGGNRESVIRGVSRTSYRCPPFF